jgi:hypothetical protein
MAGNRLLFATLALLACGVLGADQLEYRVAATFVTKGGQRLTLVEGRDGRQTLLRQGDELAGGTIVEIAERYIRVDDGARQWIVPLEGGFAAALVQPPDDAAPRVRAVELGEALREKIGMIAADEAGAPALADLLELSAGASVRQVGMEGSPVTDDLAAAQAIMAAIAEGRVPQLFIDSDLGPLEVYLLPAETIEIAP